MRTQLQSALDKVNIALLNSLEHGQEIELNDTYTLYKYCEEDIVVINETEEWNEVLQVMWDEFNISYEVLDYTKEAIFI